MCIQPATIPTQKPQARRYCQWVYDAATTRRLLEDQIPAPLIVATDGGSWTYLVTLRDDGVYLMGHVLSSRGSGYEIYEARPENGGCTCARATYRRRGQGPCKHALALRAALSWLEARS